MPEQDGDQVVPSKSEVGDANVVKDKAKLVGASHKLLICPGADLKHEVIWFEISKLSSRPIIGVEVKFLQIQVCGWSEKAPALSLWSAPPRRILPQLASAPR